MDQPFHLFDVAMATYNNSICRMEKMAALCVALCVRLKYSPRTASNEKEIVRCEADTPTSHPGKDTSIERRNSAN